MNKEFGVKYPEVISVRLTEVEKKQLDHIIEDLETNRSQFIRKKIKRIIQSKINKT